MSEELYFFKFNREKAATELTRTLQSPSDLSYQAFIENGSNEELRFPEIVGKVSNNIETLSIDELSSLYDWFYNKNDKFQSQVGYKSFERIVCEDLASNGLELFFEIDSKTPVRQFHENWIEYEYLSQTEISHDCKAQELDGLLNYIICYSGEINMLLNANYYNYDIDCEYNQQIRKAIAEINHVSNSCFHNLALQTFKANLDEFTQTLKLIPKLVAFRQLPENRSGYALHPDTELYEISRNEDKILELAGQFYYATACKKNLSGYLGRVKLLHSY